MDGHTSEGEESSEIVWQTRQVVGRSRVGHKAESALVEGHLRVNCHHRDATRGKQSSAGVESVSCSHGEDRFVALSHHRLEMVELLKVVLKSILVALLLHVEHGSEVGTVGPLLACAGLHHNGLSQSILVE